MKRKLFFALCVIGLGSSVGCSSERAMDPAGGSGAGAAGSGAGDSAAGSGGGDGASGATSDPGKPVLDVETPFAQLPANCKGFEVAGLKFSPGGDVLPNSCAPFDNLRNNPYAIRCVDADPSYHTAFPGDDFCVLPPPADKGTQLHVGPSDYADVPAEFLMQPGEEKVEYYYINATTTDDHYYYRTNLRMRAGSHHMIIRVQSDDHVDGWSAEQDLLGTLRADTATNRSFGGSQRPDEDRPTGTLAVPPENTDIGELLEKGQQFDFNLHHFNLTQAPILREVWVNVWYKPQSEVKRQIQGISIVGNPRDLNIPAHEHRVLHYSCPVTGPVRIITLNGHRHASTSRFGAWVVRADGTTQSVYESFNYNDMPTYQFDSLSKNPVPSVDTKTDGGATGLLELDAGDQMHFVCDVTNKLDQPLKFANEVETGEMCILFGTRIGASLCGLVNRVQE
jgi:hypothetical protein